MSARSLRQAVEQDDVEAAAIAISTDAYPGLRAEHVRSALDRLAAELAPHVYAARGHARLGRVLAGIYGTLGFRTPDSYDDPRLHHLSSVIERRAGSPVALAVVSIAIASRLGISLRGVAFPGHFMVRYDAAEPIFIDPSTGAFPFPAECLGKLASDELRVPLEETDRFLAPVGARTIAIRLLQNLMRSYEERGDQGRALLVADRLFDITGAASARCDRGLRAALLGAPHAALEDLTAYLRDHDDAEVSKTASRLHPGPIDLN
jgi:regulator of sirC expression with transglutaminase-like and TPR domain